MQGPLQPLKVDPLAIAVSVSTVPLAKLAEQVPVGVLVPLKLQAIKPPLSKTTPFPVAPLPGVIFRVKFDAPVLKVAVTVSVPAGILKVQVEPETVHEVGAPLQPLNVEPVVGVSVKTTDVLNVANTEQPDTGRPGPQSILPPVAFTTLLVTVPVPLPAGVRVSKKVLGTKVAVAFGVEVLMVKTQGFVEVLTQGPVVQPLKSSPAAGVAVRVTCVPTLKVALQTLGGPGFAQLISLVIVGFEVLVTAPVPVTVTDKLSCSVVKVALTV